MTRRDLTAQLRAAARASMPPDQAQRFSRFLRGLEGRVPPDVVPGTPWLPAVTIGRPSAPPKARIRAESVPEDDPQPRLL